MGQVYTPLDDLRIRTPHRFFFSRFFSFGLRTARLGSSRKVQTAPLPLTSCADVQPQRLAKG